MFRGCDTQRVCDAVEEVDFEYIDLGVALDDIDECLQDRGLALVIEPTLYTAKVFAEIGGLVYLLSVMPCECQPL